MSRIYIYGLFAPRSGKCLYVGATCEPTVRSRCHKLKRTTKGNPFVFKVLRVVDIMDSSKWETFFITKYKKAGEARYNKILKGTQKGITRYCFYVIYAILSKGERFLTKSDYLARNVKLLAELEKEYGRINFDVNITKQRNGTFKIGAF